MKIKKGDNVIVLQGKDRGKTGKVLHALISTDRVVVEGVNIIKRHKKTTQKGKGGEIIDLTAPIHVSNVAIVDPKTKKASRIGYKMVDGKKVRVFKKSGIEI